MDAKLVVVGGDAKPKEIPIKTPLVIGRGREATLTLPHPLVSRRHCEIDEADGYLVVRDLGSLNGTFINNERVSDTVLPPGNLLTVGTVTFRAVYEAPAGEQPDVAVAAATEDSEGMDIEEFTMLDMDDDDADIAEVELDDLGDPDDMTEKAPPDLGQTTDDDFAEFLNNLE
jgi:predicted component of type VI protein secretion system